VDIHKFISFPSPQRNRKLKDETTKFSRLSNLVSNLNLFHEEMCLSASMGF